jgi:hypothetical protein
MLLTPKQVTFDAVFCTHALPARLLTGPVEAVMVMVPTVPLVGFPSDRSGYVRPSRHR